VLVVVHSSSNGSSVLPMILERATPMPVSYANSNDPIRPGRVYVAPSDSHLIVDDHKVVLSRGPRENGFRPAVDPLFRTAARELGPRAIGVILSGALSDGTYGLSMIRHFGGVSIVQDPHDALFPSMPLSAISHVDVDQVLPTAEIAEAIVRAVRRIAETQGETIMPREKRIEPQRPSDVTEIGDMNEAFGPPSALTCPECGGALWQVKEDRVVRYQCHVGHQYAPENLEAAQRDIIDGALWSAVRVLEEHADLKSRMADRAAETGLTLVSEGFAEGAREAHEQAQRIRSVLFTLETGDGAKPVETVGKHSRHVAANTSKRRRTGRRRKRARKT
jgi:two-component system chemotaxis response regulator CheB